MANYSSYSYQGISISGSTKKKIIIHHLNHLSLGGTEKMVGLCL